MIVKVSRYNAYGAFRAAIAQQAILAKVVAS
jgi:hypothetical protein